MALYELRTYTFPVGKLNEVLPLYTAAYPTLKKHGDKLIGYFVGDVGALNQLVHLWKFNDDADRRRFWGAVLSDEEFLRQASKWRPFIQHQEHKILFAAPFGPHR